MDEAKLTALKQAAGAASCAWQEYETLVKTDPDNSRRHTLWALFQAQFDKLCEIEQAIGNG